MELPVRFFVVVCVLCMSLMTISIDGKVDVHSDKHHDEIHMATSSKNVKDQHAESENHSKMYKHALKLKRREQLSAVKTIIAVDNDKKRKSLVSDMVSKMQKVISEAKAVLEKANFKARDAFPFSNVQLKEALGNVVENTAFFCEFALRFPSLVGKRYVNDYNLRSTIDWAYEFSIATELYDETAQKMLSLSGQQLNMIPREEDFLNPYDKQTIKEEMEREAVRLMEEAKERKAQERKAERRKKKERKPVLTKTEL